MKRLWFLFYFLVRVWNRDVQLDLLRMFILNLTLTSLSLAELYLRAFYPTNSQFIVKHTIAKKAWFIAYRSGFVHMYIPFLRIKPWLLSGKMWLIYRTHFLVKSSHFELGAICLDIHFKYIDNSILISTQPWMCLFLAHGVKSCGTNSPCSSNPTIHQELVRVRPKHVSNDTSGDVVVFCPFDLEVIGSITILG